MSMINMSALTSEAIVRLVIMGHPGLVTGEPVTSEDIVDDLRNYLKCWKGVKSFMAEWEE